MNKIYVWVYAIILVSTSVSFFVLCDRIHSRLNKIARCYEELVDINQKTLRLNRDVQRLLEETTHTMHVYMEYSSSLEDVIDEYVNIHNKNEVNLNELKKEAIERVDAMRQD